VGVAEAGGVIQAGGNILMTQPGKRFEDVVKTVPGTQMRKDSSHRDACTLNDGFSVADIRVGFDSVHVLNMGGNYTFVNAVTCGAF